jgi:hypothetical protein
MGIVVVVPSGWAKKEGTVGQVKISEFQNRILGLSLVMDRNLAIFCKVGKVF